MMKGSWLWFVPVGCLALAFGGLRLAQLVRSPLGQRPPEAFDLPRYPGAYAFKSYTRDPYSKSVAYLVKQASANEIADFYRKQLVGEHYRVVGDQRLRLGVPPAKEGAPPRQAPARHVLFTNREKDRVVLLTAIEQPAHGARTQVALAFGSLAYWFHPPVKPPAAGGAATGPASAKQTAGAASGRKSPG
jgi:hypothetical protein